MYKHIILAYDGSASGQNALLSIKELAHWEKPKFTLLAVVPTPLDAGTLEVGYLAHTDTTGFEEDLKNQLRRGVKSLRAMGFDATGELLRGEVIRELTRYAEEKSADLIVVGHTHEKNLEQAGLCLYTHILHLSELAQEMLSSLLSHQPLLWVKL